VQFVGYIQPAPKLQVRMTIVEPTHFGTLRCSTTNVLHAPVARFGPAMAQVALRKAVHVGFVPDTVARGGYLS